MTFKQKAKKKGRPTSTFKIRSIRGITPKGFDPNNYRIVKGKIIFKKKRKKKKK